MFLLCTGVSIYFLSEINYIFDSRYTLSTQLEIPIHLGLPLNSLNPRLFSSDHKYIYMSPRAVMVKAMDCGIVVSGFVLQSRYDVHFRANTLGKVMNPLILPAMG